MTNEEIELVAVAFTLDHERRQGRFPEDVHEQEDGWDVSSYADEGKQHLERRIEVKGKTRTVEQFLASSDFVYLTTAEKVALEGEPDRYWLYIVAGVREDGASELVAIDGPTLLQPGRLTTWIQHIVHLKAAEVRRLRTVD